ncbi:MAG: hypothetical protein AMXMBFR84_50900 [Candidatus Hydrogenedentota bacterium]
MKLRFDKHVAAQPVVSQAQLRTRTTPHRKLPIFRALVLTLIGLGLGFTMYQYWRLRNIYTYGIVSAQTDFISAPRVGTIESLTIQRGQWVKKGDLLCSFHPQVSPQEREAEQALLESIGKVAESVEKEQANRVAQAAAEVERLKRLYDEEAVFRNHAIDFARIEVAKLSDLYEQKKKRMVKYTQLVELDAAVQSDVETAKNEASMALRSLEQAQSELALAEARMLPNDADITKAKLELERVQNAAASPELTIERAKFALEFSSKLREPIEFHAPFDGMVLEVHTTDGALVTDGKPLISLTATSGVWIDAYVPVDKAIEVATGRPVHVYVPGSDDPILGQITVSPGAAVRVPEILRDSMPRLQTAVLTRVNLDSSHNLFPGTIVRLVLRKGIPSQKVE